MASTYVNDLRLNELGTGDASGTWGTITNLNLELIGEGLSYGTQDCFTTDADATTTVADGASDPARSMYFKVTSSATLTATRTLTIAPNTVSRLQFIENATTGGQSINISQGSGSNVTIPTGATKAVYLDGAGSGAAVTDAFADLSVVTLDATTLQIGGTSITATATELNYNDITTLGQVQASKTVTADSSGFVNFGDNEKIRLGTGNDLEIYHDGSNSWIYENGTGSLYLSSNGNGVNIRGTHGEDGIVVNANADVELYYDNAKKLETKSDGVDITGELQADSLDIDGNADISGNLVMSGGGNIDLSDAAQLRLGASQDMLIYHDGSNSRIDDAGTGSLVLRGNAAITLEKYTGENMASFNADGAVNLYHNNALKLATKSDGVDITGELQCDTLDVDGASDFTGNMTVNNSDITITGTGNRSLNVISSNALATMEIGGSTGAFIDLKTPSSDDFDMRIQGDGGSGGSIAIAGGNFSISGGTTLFNAAHSGAVTLYHNGSAKLATASDGIYVTGNVQSSTGYFEGANPNDRIQVNASSIDFYIDASNEFRMESDGDFHADGDVIAFSTTVSDERLKTDIEKIENATDKVSQLNGYTFTYKADGKKSAGVIAQEVEKVLPSAVSEKELPLKMDDGVAYKTVQYDQIIGLLIESIKELKQEINELKGK
jgi:hypothetical protein